MQKIDFKVAVGGLRKRNIVTHIFAIKRNLNNF